MGRRPYVVISLPFLLIGAGMIASGAWRMHLANSSRGWMTVPGIVTSAEVTLGSAIDGAPKYIPRIAFTYTVDGVPYESDAYTFGRRSYLEQDRAESLVAGYAPSTSVTIHYNPRKPSQAVLRRGDTSGLHVIIGTGLVVLALGGAAIGYGYWRRPPYEKLRA